MDSKRAPNLRMETLKLQIETTGEASEETDRGSDFLKMISEKAELVYGIALN